MLTQDLMIAALQHRNMGNDQAANMMELAAAEIGRLRTALRVNALRWGHTDAEIDAILNPT